MRRSGKTTRLVNKAVEALFEKGEIFIPSDGLLYSNIRQNDLILCSKKYPTFIDPDSEKGNYAQRHFKNKLFDRLRLEHPEQFELDKDLIRLKENV